MEANIQKVLLIGGIVGLAVLVLIGIDRAGLRARRRAERRAKLAARQDELAVSTSPSRIRTQLFIILWSAVGAVLMFMGQIRLPGGRQILTWFGAVFGASISIVGLVIAVKPFRPAESTGDRPPNPELPRPARRQAEGRSGGARRVLNEPILGISNP